MLATAWDAPGIRWVCRAFSAKGDDRLCDLSPCPRPCLFSGTGEDGNDRHASLGILSGIFILYMERSGAYGGEDAALSVSVALPLMSCQGSVRKGTGSGVFPL